MLVRLGNSCPWPPPKTERLKSNTQNLAGARDPALGEP
jgi:hypothetical protein